MTHRLTRISYEKCGVPLFWLFINSSCCEEQNLATLDLLQVMTNDS